MKILTIRFRNLNSLAGDWEINLQNPVFTSSGIFAITGPTGSGKTTILDAICLALYGQTPRLERITATTNEIMTRHTGECFAEVTFSSSAGVFRCNWRQKRAHGKPDGKLQQPEHEIVDALTNQILESKIKEVGNRVREATGMDFEQFTRSILLAQGGFSAFLEAKPDERAPILEQITGTGIYSEISRTVHERFNEEKTKLLTLETKAGMIAVLSDEEITTFISEKESKEAISSEIEAKIKDTREVIDTHIRREVLKTELDALLSNQENHAKRREQSATEIEKLVTGKRAAQFEPSLKAITTLRDKIDQGTDQVSHVMKTAADAEEAYHSVILLLKEAEEEYKRVENLLIQEGPLLTQVREYDTIIQGLSEGIKNLKTGIHERQEKKDKTNTILSGLLTKNNEYDSLMRNAESYLITHESDARLLTDYSGIVRQIDEWKRHQNTLISVNQKRKDTIELQKIADEKHQQTILAVNDHQKELDHLDAIISDLKIQMQNLVDTSDFKTLQNTEKNLQKRIDLLKIVENTIINHQSLVTELTELKNNYSTWELHVAANKKRKNDLLLDSVRQEERVSSYERELVLAITVRDLNEERKRLHEGEPCPLCGSKVHPYTSQNTPIVSEKEAALAQAKKSLKELTGEISKIDATIISSEKDIARNIQDQTAAQNKIKDAQEIWIAGADELGIPTTIPEKDKLVLIQNEKAQAEKSIIDTASRIASIEETDKRIRDAELARAAAKDTQTHLVQAETDARFKAEGIKTEVQRLIREIEEQTGTFEEVHQALVLALTPYNYQVIDSTTIEGISDNLKSRYSSYILHETKKKELDSLITDISPLISSNQTSISAIDEEIAGREITLAAQKEKYFIIVAEREKVYGNKTPQEEEERLKVLNQAAKESYTRAKLSSDEKRTAWDTLSGQVQSLLASLEVQRRELEEQFSRFLQGITSAGFQTESALKEALLTDEEIFRLEKLIADLTQEETTLSALITDKNAEIVRIDASFKRENTREELELALRELKHKLDTLREDIGGIRTKLEEDGTRRTQMAGTIARIEDQKHERDRWERLHALIGSADGKKFRVFAQGLTFQLLLRRTGICR